MTAIEKQGDSEKMAKAEVPLPDETLAAFGGDELRARVFYEKYALRNAKGEQVEKTPDKLWLRVARELASVEVSEKRQEWTDKFYWLLEDFKFVPGGRILFGAGQPRRSTLLNCYFFRIKEDSIEAIFDWCKEAARTYSFGGGVGTDISVLRPRGSPVNNSAIFSTGSVSFMELLSTTTGTIGQAGRRGALMISIRVDHPDVFDFINVKKDLKKVNYANISIKITDEFMRAVESDGDFELRFDNERITNFRKTVKARTIWNQLVKAAWQSDEPGLLFWDTIKRDSTTEYNNMEVQGVNPCSEQTLENYGCCCLGSVNLSYFVKDAFTERASIDWDGLVKASQYATRFLDNVLDYNADRHPLPQQREASLWSRRIGVGITGLGDMLIKLGLKYDDEATVEFVDKLFERIKNIIYDHSSDLAAEKGPAPAFDAEKHLAQPFVKRLDLKVRDKIKAQGIRNCAVTTVPPVGSGSILAACSSGVEPVFALSYTRRSKSLSEGEFKVYHPLVKDYMQVQRITDEKSLPPYFVTSHQIKPEMRVRMQAAIQKHIDTAISSTVNLPQEISTEEVANIYQLAWKLGCKGITVYREGSREGILETDSVEKKATEQKTPLEFERPKVLTGRTLKLKLPQGSLYVTANTDEVGSLKEVFVTLGKLGGDEKADAEAIGRLISLYLQHGGDIQNVIRMMKGIRGKYVSWDEGVQLLSIPDATAKALEVLVAGRVTKEASAPLVQGGTCPDCGENAIIFEGGCYKCSSCGYSKCE